MLALSAEYVETRSLRAMEARRSNLDRALASSVWKKCSNIELIPAFYPILPALFGAGLKMGDAEKPCSIRCYGQGRVGEVAIGDFSAATAAGKAGVNPVRGAWAYD